MQTRFRLALAAVLLAAATLTSRYAAPRAQAAAAAGAGQGSSTLDDQVELAVTVYNSDIALVRDVRELQLPRGTFDLHFMDILGRLRPGLFARVDLGAK